jgi:hypothetical protein
MRKTIVSQLARFANEPQWIDLERAARVEFTSERPDHPIEAALSASAGSGWRADQPGEQTIRLLFDEPRDIRSIRVGFRETETERTQEFVLRWSTGPEQPLREIVRQQWNFSPNGSISETEDYSVQLRRVSLLELAIRPDISGRNAVASLRELRLA